MKKDNEIRSLRLELGMTQKEFSEYFGIPFRTLQDWDNGSSRCASYLVNLISYKVKTEIKQG